MIGRLNHVAIAVPNLEKATERYHLTLGAQVSEPQALPDHGVTVVFVQLENTKLELLHPLGENSPITGFLARHPEGGIHHMCFEVNDLADAAARLLASGARILGDGKPKVGAHGLPVLFLHPKDFDGTLIELEEVKPEMQPA
ncbi:MAG: methylmalonyl-CoA epimerase [Devosia nanyangense]|jgi:methylmalonyl-CoA/ethylmalonyl-CoA epimerase|nr:methylmalonyl-CoA epimerase [Devosia nanyangense]